MRRHKLTPEPDARRALARAIERYGELGPMEAERAAGDVARDLAMLLAEVCGVARLAMVDHVLFDGPLHDATLGRDPRATELFVAAIDYVGVVLESRAAEVQDLQVEASGRRTFPRPTRPPNREAIAAAGLSSEARLNSILRRLAWETETPSGFEARG